MYPSSSSSSTADRASIPIYAGYQSPAKRRPFASVDGGLQLRDLSLDTGADSRPAFTHAHGHASPTRSPSRAEQIAFLRQRSPRQAPTHPRTAGLFQPEASLPLPSMHVPSMLDEEDDDAAADAQRRAMARAEQRWRDSSASVAPRASSIHAASSAAVAARPALPAHLRAEPAKPTASSSTYTAQSAAHTSVSSTPSAVLPSALSAAVDPAMLPAVHNFLRSVQSVDPSLPACELTPHTVPALHAMQAHLRESDERAAMVEEELNEASREYTAEASRLQSLLSRLGVSLTSLSPTGQQHAGVLIDLAQLLALKNTDAASYVSALVDVRDSLHASQDALSSTLSLRDEFRRRTADERRLHQELLALDAQLESESRDAAADLDAKRKQVTYFHVKTKEYERETKELEAVLSSSGFSPEWSHESIVALSDEIASIGARIEPLDQQLQTYHQLPPDLTLARIRVAEARQQLAELEDQFSSDIRQMQETDL